MLWIIFIALVMVCFKIKQTFYSITHHRIAFTKFINKLLSIAIYFFFLWVLICQCSLKAFIVSVYRFEVWKKFFEKKIKDGVFHRNITFDTSPPLPPIPLTVLSIFLNPTYKQVKRFRYCSNLLFSFHWTNFLKRKITSLVTGFRILNSVFRRFLKRPHISSFCGASKSASNDVWKCVLQ